jgi:hypothetical protein
MNPAFTAQYPSDPLSTRNPETMTVTIVMIAVARVSKKFMRSDELDLGDDVVPLAGRHRDLDLFVEFPPDQPTP